MPRIQVSRIGLVQVGEQVTPGNSWISNISNFSISISDKTLLETFKHHEMLMLLISVETETNSQRLRCAVGNPGMHLQVGLVPPGEHATTSNISNFVSAFPKIFLEKFRRIYVTDFRRDRVRVPSPKQKRLAKLRQLIDKLEGEVDSLCDGCSDWPKTFSEIRKVLGSDDTIP